MTCRPPRANSVCGGRTQSGVFCFQKSVDGLRGQQSRPCARPPGIMPRHAALAAALCAACAACVAGASAARHSSLFASDAVAAHTPLQTSHIYPRPLFTQKVGEGEHHQCGQYELPKR